MTDIPVPPRPAASVIVMRHNPAGAPQVLMIERAEAMRFAGGAMAFPGGGVDDTDRDHASQVAPAGDVEELAARIAAVRETIEECGLVLGLTAGLAGPDQSCGLRSALKSGTGLAQAAAPLGLEFDFSDIVPFARWCPSPHATHRRYDTRFFLAVAEHTTADLSPDGGETKRLVWHTAREVLDEAEAGRVKIIFPTRRNLERLAQFESIDALKDHALSYPVTLIQPWIESRNGVDHLCIPEGLGYPVTAESLETALRG